LGARGARTKIAAATCHELVVGGEVLGPRPARDGEDRLEVDGCRAAEAPVVVAREDEAQERAAQGLGAELVHWLLLALGHQIRVVWRR
ncbi:unnamed protein product, partial [Pelagomonas calceolata]